MVHCFLGFVLLRYSNSILRMAGSCVVIDFRRSHMSIDSFQGLEKELFIVSSVRGNSRRSVGFLGDSRRANVALTRAKRGLIVVGNKETLSGDDRIWKPWLQEMSEVALEATDVVYHFQFPPDIYVPAR